MERRDLFKAVGLIAAAPLMAAAAPLVTSSAFAADGKKLKFVHILWGMTDANVQFHIKAGEAYMAAHPEVEIQYLGPENYDPAEHAKFLDTVINSKPDGIAMHISSVDALLPGLKAAKSAGIPFVSVTSHPPGEEDNKKLEGYYLTWVGANESIIGEEMAKWLVKTHGAPKHAAFLLAQSGHAGMEQRAAGFFKALPEGVKTDKVVIGEEPGKAMDIIRAYLMANPDVDAIWGLALANKWMTDVVAELGRTNILTLTDADAPTSLECVDQGLCAATFSQQFPLQAPLAYEVLFNYNRTGMAPTAPIITGPMIVDETTVKVVKATVTKVLGEESYFKMSPF